ncbi:MAG: hypothetical protein RLN89_12540, partial [Parvibaculum sp.]
SVVPRDAVQAGQPQPRAEVRPEMRAQERSSATTQRGELPRQDGPRQEPAMTQKQAPRSEEGLVSSSYEEDQLEIPTFLRRQAN